METKSKQQLEQDRNFSIETSFPIYFEGISNRGSSLRATYQPGFLEEQRNREIDGYSFCLLQIAEYEKHVAGIERELGMSAESRLEALLQRIDTLKRSLDDFKNNALRKAEGAACTR